ncbi:hypothetical protein Q7P37_002318 [Cladosporium fusiforme]
MAGDKTSGTQARPGTLDVYCVTPDGKKTYIGWALDKKKLVSFSKTADRHLTPDDYTKPKLETRKYPPKKAAPSSDLLLPNADKRAAEMTLKWINENSIEKPKAFELPFELGEKSGSSADFNQALNIHRAHHAFDLQPAPRGQNTRDAIFKWIGSRDGENEITVDDFKNCMEKAHFDGGIIQKIMNKVAWLSVVNKIPQETLDAIKEYCRQTDNYTSIKAMGEEIIKKRKDKRRRKGRPEETGW